MNNRTESGKYTNMWKLNNMILRNQWAKQNVKKYKIKRLDHEEIKQSRTDKITVKEIESVLKNLPTKKYQG